MLIIKSNNEPSRPPFTRAALLGPLSERFFRPPDEMDDAARKLEEAAGQARDLVPLARSILHDHGIRVTPRKVIQRVTRRAEEEESSNELEECVRGVLRWYADVLSEARRRVGSEAGLRPEELLVAVVQVAQDRRGSLREAADILTSEADSDEGFDRDPQEWARRLLESVADVSPSVPPPAVLKLGIGKKPSRAHALAAVLLAWAALLEDACGILHGG